MRLRVIAISDTHIQSLNELPQKAIDVLSKADIILHAGDYTGIQLILDLKELTEFKGVYGNMDPPSIKAQLRSVEVIEEKGFKIGLTHPSEGGSPFGLIDRVSRHFKDVDVVVYGHSHKARKDVVGEVIYLNPGSLTGAFPAIRKTCAEITVGDKIDVNIIEL